MRREAENFWMHQLVTIYPFGMNDKVDGMDGFATDMNCAKKRNFKHYFSNPLPNVKRRAKFTINNSTSTNKLTETIQKETPENYEIRDMYQMFRSNKNMETTKLLKEVENTRKDKESLLASKLLAIIKLNRKKHIVTTEKIPIFIKVAANPADPLRNKRSTRVTNSERQISKLVSSYAELERVNRQRLPYLQTIQHHLGKFYTPVVAPNDDSEENEENKLENSDNSSNPQNILGALNMLPA
ncbi:hypothetical protein DdX_20285 [Ditylenchus destructor]|uniref:Uncharacterized protein n=1 Tax=Ditylenchus destructor TaxID=166010 RepID=A0AAD4MHG5_9BILA|nr:hypothetical protein DdX_20285 [Ditylenchus destructor]